MPLILKVNGKTDIPPSDDAFSTLNASVEDAVRLGADAVGYTLYVGSPRQDEDLHQLKGVREDCDRYGMPLVDLGLPARRDIDKKGGQNSFYAIDYAARMAMEMGADVVKLNMPKIDPDKDKDSPAPYNEWTASAGGGDRHMRRVRRPRRWSCSRAARRSTTSQSSARPARSCRPAASA